MKKRMYSLLLSVIMCLSLCVPGYASQTSLVEFTGFSYNMDGSQIDSDYGYSCSANITESNGQLVVNNICIFPAIDGFSVPTQMILSESFDNTYEADIAGTNFSLIIEKHSNDYYIDIFNDTKCFAFGGNRLSKMTSYFSRTARNIDAVTEEQVTIGNKNEVMSDSDVALFTKTGNNLRIQAIWNPNRSNRLSLRVNTTSTGAGEWIKRIQIKNGAVPSSYVIVSANPTGINNSSSFTEYLSYMLGFIEYKVFIPSFSSTTSISSINQHTFTFDFSMGIAWGDIKYSTDTSSNGMLMHLFLDHNGVKPTPTGKLVITEHITAYGTATAFLSF